MTVLWDRYAALTLGSKDSGQAARFEALKVVFQVEKTSESNANTAKISIFNMSDEGRALAEAAKAFVLLEAGYRDNFGQLFIGDITRAYISRQGPDWVTTVECGDGAEALRSTHIDKSYAPDTDYQDIIKDVAQSFVDQGKVVIGSLLGLKSEKSQTGLSVSGNSKAVLDDLAQKQGLEWSIQDESVQILPKDKDSGRQAVLLTPQTGLIGSPIRREVEGGAGVEFTALIQVALSPGRLVQIESRQVSGIFKLRQVSFAGDTHGQSWYANGKAVAL
jgi:hypothetical protein